MDDAIISVARLVGSGICVSASDGQRVYQAIYDNLSCGRRVSISFEAVTRLTTAFLNAAIGQLYGEFSEDFLRRHLAPPIVADRRQLVQLKLVVDRAKIFFRDPERVTVAFAESLELDE